jgi:integrase
MAGRRGNGEGSVYQRADGTWRGQALIAGVRRSVSGKTRREVQGKLRQLLADADKGIVASTERPTLAQHIDRWLTGMLGPSVRPQTVRGYRTVARLYLLPTLGHLQLAKIRADHIQRLYGQLTERGLAPKTVRNAHAVLRHALGQAVEWNLVPRNVADLARPPRVPRAEVVALSPEEVRTLLAAARPTRWGALVAAALATGMRQSELLGLRWGDVDLAAGVLRVQRQLQRDGSFAEPKTKKGRRAIDLPPSSVAVLAAHRDAQAAERALAGADWRDGDLVFCTQRGKPLQQRNVLRAFKRLLDVAGVRDVPFHALRHTAATLLLAKGTHPKVVQERLGHSTIAMTLDTYSAYIPSLGRAAADQLDDFLS